MIHQRLQIDTVPDCCTGFVSRFEGEEFAVLTDFERERESAWTGERLFLGFFWRDLSGEMVADFRFQVFPLQREIFIGSIEVHPDRRSLGIGTGLVEQLESSVSHEPGNWNVRLFAREKIAGFWERLGYEREDDVRYLSKEVT